MPHLFTIGYAAHTPETLIAELLSAGVQLLADIRANPVSRKPGFSKRQLEAATTAAGIAYQSWRDLGIPSADRKQAASATGWESLLADYRASLDDPAQRGPAAVRLAALVQQTPTAILCLETDLDHCHRKPLADWVAHHAGIEVTHL
jgi:uncharacterized protein (DUF488 family)